MRSILFAGFSALAVSIGVGQVYHGVALAPNGLDAWVVNIDSVEVFHTPDFGMNWEPQTIATTRRQFHVFFLNEDMGWTCGDIGAIHATTNGGQDWFRQNLGGPKFASRLQFIDASYGWASGGTAMLMASRNGGQEWRLDYFPSPPFPTDTVDFQGLSFVDTATGWLAAGRYPEEDSLGNPTFTGGQGYIARVAASGDTFVRELQRLDTVYDFYDVDFTDAANGWVVGGEDNQMAAAVFHTTNGGAEWTQQPVPSGARFLRGVDFVSRNQGWACGRNGTIIHTSDGGTNWSRQTSIAESTLFDIQFVDSLRGIAVGYQIVLYTTDGGATWARGYGGVEENGSGYRPAVARLAVRQNPSRGGVLFAGSGVTGNYLVSVYDAAGCLVRALRGSSRGGVSQVEWQGDDENGNAVRSGLYLARLEGGEATAVARFVLLKE